MKTHIVTYTYRDMASLDIRLDQHRCSSFYCSSSQQATQRFFAPYPDEVRYLRQLGTFPGFSCFEINETEILNETSLFLLDLSKTNHRLGRLD